MALSAILYDIEIARAIPSDYEDRVEGIKYCQGWEDYLGMGISVIGVYDYQEERYRVFCRDNMAGFQDLVNNRDIVVSFNGDRFDSRVLAAAGINIPAIKSYDILQEIWASQGLPAEFNRMTHGGYSLGACCTANFGTKKSGDGGAAPIDWQRAKIGTVIDYCLSDVALTKSLFDLILQCGRIKNPKNSKTFLEVKSPIIDGGESGALDFE